MSVDLRCTPLGKFELNHQITELFFNLLLCLCNFFGDRRQPGPPTLGRSLSSASSRASHIVQRPRTYSRYISEGGSDSVFTRHDSSSSRMSNLLLQARSLEMSQGEWGCATYFSRPFYPLGGHDFFEGACLTFFPIVLVKSEVGNPWK